VTLLFVVGRERQPVLLPHPCVDLAGIEQQPAVCLVERNLVAANQTAHGVLGL
jgi:hypothetical protein